MEKTSFKVIEKASMSLSTVIRRQTKKLPPTFASLSTGFTSFTPEIVKKDDLVSVLVETTLLDKVLGDLGDLRTEERVVPLSETLFSALVTLSTASQLLKDVRVQRVQTKKDHQLHLDAAATDVALVDATSTRLVVETGKDVFVGIVDSGFDLSHPMFRDSTGKLRVEGLLDQNGAAPVEFTRAQLETGWANGTNPGKDENGHGTHVASIAGGTKFNGFEGIAPDARFLLVKTNFQDTADAVKWIFTKAGSKPCVINMSLGMHFGSHDGSSAEELLIDQLSGPGKIVVISAGNEREKNLHIGGRFLPNESQSVIFDVPRQQQGPPRAFLTMWYEPVDTFSFALITPTGQELVVPTTGNVDTFSSTSLDIEIGRQIYAPSNLIQVQISLSYRTLNPASSTLNGWGMRMKCDTATIGRLDAWFANDGFGRFRPHILVEPMRTIGMSATARSCIAVASHVSKNTWISNDGAQQDLGVLIGRTSPFSSQGPTRDGRRKPDISAPGQFLTAAMATGSELANVGERALSAKRLLTIEGTSMSAPVVTGIVALLLQKKKTLKPDQVREILAASAKTDSHIGTVGWNPTYGHGKVDIQKAIASI